jgi:trimethylamine:corrinoid methyltransferase-like protein
MSRDRLRILSATELQSIHEASLTILRDTGVLLQHPGIVQALVGAGARVESAHPVVHLPETLVMGCLDLAGTKYVLHG